MFRKIGLATTLVVALLAAGCSGGITTLTADQIKEIQTLTTTACGFLPTLVTIAALAGASGTVAVPISSIAEAICKAVSTQSHKLGEDTTTRTTVTVDGKQVEVVISGYFVK